MLVNGRTVWEEMLNNIWDWSLEFGVMDDAGVVMGAAYKDPNNPDKIYSAHLVRAREIVGNRLWFLIPGIGTQGGDVEKTVKAGMDSRGQGMIINSSSGIIHASQEDDFAEIARQKTLVLRDTINQFRRTV